uniref:Uncharacterized protein n=1 Tax=Pseudomonas phage PAKlein3 TaxID=3230132 RepID=A0AAU8GS43_9VIRU
MMVIGSRNEPTESSSTQGWQKAKSLTKPLAFCLGLKENDVKGRM